MQRALSMLVGILSIAVAAALAYSFSEQFFWQLPYGR